MSSPGYATPLIVEPRGSHRLLLAWGALVSAALAALLLLPLTWALPGALFLLAGSWHEWRMLHACRRLEWRAGGEWRVATPQGRRTARLASGTYCSRWFVVLVFATDAGRVRRVLLPDSLDPATWRRLRVRLRIEGGSRQ